MPSGGCLCGNVQYNYTGEPALKVTLVFGMCGLLADSVILQAVCHCITCRHMSGSVFTTNIAIPKDKFNITKGVPKMYDTIHDSGMNLKYFFCANCGCTISKVADGDGFQNVVLVQAGSLNDEPGIEAANPEVEFYISKRAKWLSALEGKGQMQEFS